MHEMKDSSVALVRIGYDGRVHKYYRGPLAKERFENERRILRYLEEKGCDFVPRILEEDEAKLYLATTNCGAKADKVSEEKMNALFEELFTYGVQHGDRAARNVTYSPQAGRFCLIDFEFAHITETGEGLSLEESEKVIQELKRQKEEQL